MYNAITLIIDLINGLAEKHTNMSFLYGYDQFLSQHLIEVEPLSDYSSDDYLIDEVKAVKAFVKEFPEQSILFISNDPYIKVNDPIHYAKAGSITYFSQLYIETLDLTSENSVTFENSITVSASVVELFDDVVYSMNADQNFGLDDDCDLLQVFNFGGIVRVAGDYNYAMAA